MFHSALYRLEGSQKKCLFVLGVAPAFLEFL